MSDELSAEIIESVKRSLEEDIGPGDATTDSIVPLGAVARGRIIAKEDGVVAGLDVARAAFEMVDPRVNFMPLVAEGARIVNQQTLADVTGPARALLTAERTALTFSGECLESRPSPADS